MEWAPLEDIDAVEPIGEGDADCLREVYAVLRRHGKQARFGLTLLHKHFPMGDDEVLLERTNAATRQLVLEPAKADSPDVVRSIQTSWMLGEDGQGEVTRGCYRRCFKNVWGSHSDGGHYEA
jgi:hypothetical protein